MKLKEALKLAHERFDEDKVEGIEFKEASETELGKRVYVCVFTSFNSIKNTNERIKFVNDVLKGKEKSRDMFLGFGKFLGRRYYKNDKGEIDFQVVIYDFEYLIKCVHYREEQIKTFHCSWADLGEKWFRESQKEMVTFT